MTVAVTPTGRATALPLADRRWWVGLSVDRVLWLLAVALGGSIVWWAPHPPMTDLPQHAGQVRLLHDIVLGQSPWASQLRLNLLTPYLIGYGIALPLSFLMPVTVALKLMLTAAYFCFVAICVRLARHWQCDPRLDWLYVPSFFGFAFGWGFFTFLVASPIGLLFLHVSERYAVRTTFRSALAVVLCGTVLLASHGLMFLFCASLGAAIVAALTPLRLWPRRSAPFVGLLLLFVAYFIASTRIKAATDGTPANVVIWDLGWWRLLHVLAYSLVEDPRIHMALVAAAALLVVPFLMGSRLSMARRVPIVVMTGVLIVLLLTPTFAFRTAFLNERFALFFLPAYAWLFAAPAPADKTAMRGRLAMAVLPLCAFAAIGWHAFHFWRFGHESAAIDAQLQRLEPRQRIFSLIFDNRSEAGRMPNAYNHYPAWYQAESGGLAEFNFAWYPPQIVRFRADHPPRAKPLFGWTGDRFEWVKDGGDEATYFVVRHAATVPPTLFSGAPCAPTIDWQGGEWTIYKRVPTCR